MIIITITRTSRNLYENTFVVTEALVYNMSGFREALFCWACSFKFWFNTSHPWQNQDGGCICMYD